MAVRRDSINVDVNINGKNAGKTLSEIKKETQQLYRELRLLEPGTEAFNKKLGELKGKQATLKGIENEIKGIGKATHDLNVKSGTNGSGGGGFFGFLKGGGVVAIGVMVAQFAMKIVKGVADIGAKLLEGALRLEAFSIKTRVVFGEALPLVNKAARENAAIMGLTTQEYKAQAVAMADLLVPMGFTREEAAKLSTGMVNVSGALSAWSGGTKSAAEVNEILTKAMLGERDGLKQLGISISEADLKARLMAKGQAELTGAMLKQAQAMATQELIIEQSKDAQDSFAANTQTAGNAIKTMKSDIQQLIDDALVRLAPYINGIVGIIGKWTGSLRDYLAVKPSEEFQKEQISVNGLARAIMQAAEGSEIRKNLIQQMKAQHPAFLAGLKDEEITNAAIGDRLKTVNEEYKKKILLATSQELREDANKRQVQALKDMANAQASANKKAEEFAVKYGIVLDRSKSVEEQIRTFIPAIAAAEKAQDGFGQKLLKTTGDLVYLTGGNALAGQKLSLRESEILKNSVTRFEDGQKAYNQALVDSEKELENYNQLLLQMGYTQEQATAFLGLNTAANTANTAATAEEAAAKDKATKAWEKYRDAQRKAAESIEDLKIQLISDDTDRNIATLQLAAKRKIEALVGTPEQIQEQARLIKEVLDRELTKIAEAEAEAAQKKIDGIIAAENEGYQKQREARIQRHQEELAWAEQGIAEMSQGEEEKKLLLDLKFSEMLDAEEEHQEALRQLHSTSLQERLAFLESSGMSETEIYKRVQAELLQVDIDNNQRKVENIRKTADLKASIEKESFGVTKDILQFGIDLLGKDEAARKKHAGMIKAFATAQVIVGLLQETAGYMANPASTATLGIVGALKVALAVGRAGLAISSIQKQKFARGGFVADGPRHSEGGINLVNNRTGQVMGEMEGGEPIMILSRDTYANNRPIVDRLLESSMYHGGKSIFERGGVVGTLGTTASNSTGTEQRIDDLIKETRNMRGDLNTFRGNLRATISYDNLTDSMDEVDSIKSAAGWS